MFFHEDVIVVHRENLKLTDICDHFLPLDNWWCVAPRELSKKNMPLPHELNNINKQKVYNFTKKSMSPEWL